MPRTLIAFVIIIVACSSRPAPRQPCDRIARPEAALAAAGLRHVAVRLPAAEVAAQSNLRGGVCFERALEAALEGFLEDRRDAESPRLIAEAAPPGPDCPHEDGRARLRCYIDRSESELGLVGRQDDLDELGEMVDDHWIFYLSIPSLSDHVFWAIVDRQASGGGAPEVVVYGFN